MPELYQVKDHKVTLNLHSGQTQVWESTARIVAMVAGTQSGKTSFGPWWLWREIQRGGAGDYLAVSSSFDLFKLKMLPEMRVVFEHLLGLGRYWAGDKVIELRNPETGRFAAEGSSDPMWGRIILRSASAEGGLESATAKAAWLDEAGQDEFGLKAWDAVMRRLSLSQGRVLITTTPYNLGWLKQQVVDRAPMDPDIEVIQYASTLNPNFPQAEFERARASLPGWKFRMFYLGQFARPAGLIYSDFIDNYRVHGGHKVQPFAVPQTWPRYVGIDPGLENMGRVWLAHDTKEDVYFVYREERPERKSTREHAEDVRAIVRQNNENVVIWTVGAKSEEQQRLEWRESGVMAAEPPFHDVEAGIDKVIGLLRQHRLFFFDNLSGLMDELATYSRELDDMGQTTDKIRDKARYHLLDALRYAVAGVGQTYEDAGAIASGPTIRIGGGSY